MKVVAVVQARMRSTRLPGKVLLDLSGETVLARVVQRLRRARLIEDIVVATTTLVIDDAIIRECNRLDVPGFRGSEEDVLDRYYRAGCSVNAEAIVRITSDCPLIEPRITDKTIRAFLELSPDYASNTLRRTYPRGLDTEVLTFDALARCWGDVKHAYQRAHVTPYIYENQNLFRTVSVEDHADRSHHRWTVDTEEDLEFVRAVYDRMGSDEFTWLEVLDLLQREPELIELNRFVMQKALQEG